MNMFFGVVFTAGAWLLTCLTIDWAGSMPLVFVVQNIAIAILCTISATRSFRNFKEGKRW
jgi:hypothetical protein